MNIAYGWGASPDPNKSWHGRFLAFSAVAMKEWLLVSALGLCAGNTSLCTILYVYIHSPKWQYSKETKCKEHESQLSPEIKWYLLLPKRSLLPNLNQPLSKWAAETQSSLANTLVTLTF